MAEKQEAMIPAVISERSAIVLLDKYLRPTISTLTTAGAVIASTLLIKTIGVVIVSGLAFGVGCWLAKRFTSWLDRRLVLHDADVAARHSSTTRKPADPVM